MRQACAYRSIENPSKQDWTAVKTQLVRNSGELCGGSFSELSALELPTLHFELKERQKKTPQKNTGPLSIFPSDSCDHLTEWTPNRRHLTFFKRSGPSCREFLKETPTR